VEGECIVFNAKEANKAARDHGKEAMAGPGMEQAERSVIT
jgi:hypothetical protein